MKPLRTIAIRLFVVVACSIFLAVLGTASAAADDGPDLAAIDRYVRSEMDAQRIRGLALGIVHGDRIVHVQGFGQVEKSGPDVTSQTPFLIGSVTKSFTALAIMQLSEAGRVQLDAPVQRYLPWWRVADPDASTRVTVRQLLYQVSGLSKATGNAYATSGDTHESALGDRVRALRDAELTQPVGTTWQYSNANYWTLGMIVQAVSGQSYESYVQQHIFDPLEMRSSYTSQAEAEQHGLPMGHRYWYGFPVAAELPFDRGGLGSGGLSSSAQDMTHYIGLYLDHGRHGDTALVSPDGAAELQRAGVATGLDGVSYAMGWDVSQVRGLRTISHDGSGFDSHANVVLIPDRQWGVVVMENGENSPDEFFGSRRMTAIANGVAVMLIGEQAPAPSSASTSLWVVYGLVLGILLIQLVGMVRSVRTIRGWRASPLLRPRGALRIGLRVGVPLLVSWTWALIVLVGLPRIIRAPLPAVLMGLPDLGYPLVASAVLAFGWGLVRAIWAVRTLRAAPPGAPSPSTGATTHLSLSTSQGDSMSTPTLTPSPARTQSLVRRHPLISFFVLTYAVTWTLWAPLVIFRDQIPGPPAFVLLVLGSNVPSVLGVLFVALLRGRSGVRTLFGRLLHARIGLFWYLAVVALAVPALCAVWVSVLLGDPTQVVAATIPAVIVSFLFSIFPGSSLGEELGWRGFALPRLQARHSALAASLIVGAAWGIYHFPLFLLGSPTRPFALFLPFAIGCVIMSIFYTWMYNGTGGSLLIVVLLHATTNLPLTVVYERLGERVVPVFWLLDAILAIGAAVLIARTGAATLSRVRGKQTETP